MLALVKDFHVKKSGKYQSISKVGIEPNEEPFGVEVRNAVVTQVASLVRRTSEPAARGSTVPTQAGRTGSGRRTVYPTWQGPWKSCYICDGSGIDAEARRKNMAEAHRRYPRDPARWSR